MKKILFVFMSCFYSITYSLAIDIKVNPDINYVGMTQSTDTYTKQSAKDSPQTFFVGYNNFDKAPKNTYGRGYLTFDLKDIPSDATINSAFLQLNSVPENDSNFGGKIKVKQATLFNFPDANSWKILVGGPELATIEYSKGAGMQINGNGGDAIKKLVNEYKGQKLFLCIHNTDENKIIRFSGKTTDLYLNVSYTPKVPGSDGGSGGGSTPSSSFRINGPTVMTKGEIGTFSAGSMFTGQTVMWNVWSGLKIIGYQYNNNVSTQIQVLTNQHPQIDLMATQVQSDGKQHIAYFTIKIIPIYEIKPIGNNIVCTNSSISYTIPELQTGSTVEWTCNDKLALVSGQGTGSANFRTLGNGYGVVKAKIISQGKEYNIENKEVWIGKPSAPSSVTGFRNGQNFNLNSLYSLAVSETPGATEYIWSITDGGEIRKYDVNGNRNIEMLTSINVGWNQTKSFSLRVSAKNNCGVSEERALTGYVTFSGPGGIDEFSLRSATIEIEPEIKSVKIYNLSGVLVYSDNTVNGSFDIKSTVLTDGVYIIEKFDGENRTSEKVMLKR